MDPTILGLDDKVGLVTGGGRNIGKGCAIMLARAGCHVCVVDIEAETGRQTAKEIAAMGRKAHFVQADVRDLSQIDAMVRACIEELGGLDACVNCVGGLAGYGAIPFLDVTPKQFADVVALNFWSNFFCTNREGKSMVERKVKGSIINIASTGGLRARWGDAAYAACKAGIVNLTMQVAFELGEYGVRVNCIAPGFVPGPALQPKVRDGSLQPVADTFPLRRLPRAEELGGVAVFLASDLSSYVTGHTIAVDGGDSITSGLGLLNLIKMLSPAS